MLQYTDYVGQKLFTQAGSAVTRKWVLTFLTWECRKRHWLQKVDLCAESRSNG